MMTLLAVAAVAAAASTPATYTVEPALTRAAGVETRCYESWPYGQEHTGWWGPDPASGQVVIALHPRVCHAITRAIRGPRRAGGYQPAALHTYAHEVAHHRGATHESRPDADTLGCRLLPGLMRQLGIPPRFRRQVLLALPCPPARGRSRYS